MPKNLDLKVSITGILQPMHALRVFISPVLYWLLLLWLNSNLKATLLQFWNFAWRWERNACDVKKRTVQFPLGISKRSFFFFVDKRHFSPILSKSLSYWREINQKSLVACKEELNSHLRHTYRDKGGELASLGNMFLCVNYPFLSNYLRNQTRKQSNKTKGTACRSLACTICVKWKKDRLTKKCCNRRLFTFCTLEDYQTNAILWSLSTVCIGYTSISRNEGKQAHAAF